MPGKRMITRGSLGYGAIVACALVLLGALGLGSRAGAARIDAVDAIAAGIQRVVPSQFFGFNAEDQKAPAASRLWFGRSVPADIRSLHASLLRIPGGTEAEWLNWRTGMFVPGAPAQFTNVDRRPLLLTDWASVLKSSHTTPVFDLNVVTSTLSDQLAMLHAAARLGLPIKYVELGNELWDPRYASLFPTGAAYGRAINRWIVAVKRAYPSAQVAVSGMDTASLLTSYLPGLKQWNASMLSVVRGENAIAIHPYWQLLQRAGTSEAVNPTIASGLSEWRGVVSQDLPPLPKHVSVWLTEWNQIDLLNKGGHQCWAQALTVAAFALKTVTNERIGMSLVHDVVDSAINPYDNQPDDSLFPMFARSGGRILGPTANAFALGLIFGSISPGDAVQQLEFKRGPLLNGFAGLQGVRITTRRHASSFDVINLTDHSQRVDLAEMTAGSVEGTVLSAAPTADPAFVATDQVTRRAITTTDGDIWLPPYSIANLRPRS